MADNITIGNFLSHVSFQTKVTSDLVATDAPCSLFAVALYNQDRLLT